MIRRKHVGLHRRELTALRGRLRRTGDTPRKRRDAQMRQEGGKKKKGNVQRMKGNAQMRQERGKKRKGKETGRRSN